MSTKARCSICRNYFPKDDFLRTGLGGLGGICSEDCLATYVEKYRNKRTRRKENREKKFSGGRRLPGTCRDRVKRRDSETCRWCGTTDAVEIHHVFYRSEGGADTPRNLISLCSADHALAHTNKRKYQPILLLWLWLYYVKEENVNVETAFRLAKKHPEWVASARNFSILVHQDNKVKAAPLVSRLGNESSEGTN